MAQMKGSDPKISTIKNGNPFNRGITLMPAILSRGDNPFTRFLEVVFANQLSGWLILLASILVVGTFFEVPKLVFWFVPQWAKDGPQAVALYLQIGNYLGWVLMWNRWVLYGAKREDGKGTINHRNWLGVVVALVAAAVFWQINTFFPAIPSIPLPIILILLGLQIFPFVIPNPDENGPSKLMAALEFFLVIRAILFVLVG